jgi:hypothetical protein
VIQNEAATYSNPNGQLNPLAAATQVFADFALHRHPNLGSPVVSTAFLMDHDSGFDPKHGIYNQANAVWYQDIPYSSGDFMIDNLFRLAYPNHWLHGLTPGAPFANSAGVPNTAGFQAFLSNGGDPRPYEPMPSTRWGDNLDIINTSVPAAALRQYKVIVLLGDVHLSSSLRDDLRVWVEKGGVLVINSSQMTTADASLAGVTMTSSSQKSGTSSRWLSNGVSQSEAPYSYTPVRPVTAQVLATNENSDPLITQQQLGTGEVLLTTPSYMQSTAQNGILEICTQLLDSLMTKYSVVSIAGPPVEYVVSQGPGNIVVTVVNNSGADWTGTITVAPKNVTSVSEYTADQPVEFAASPAGATIQGQVPAYGVRVFGIEYAPATLTIPPSGKKSKL